MAQSPLEIAILYYSDDGREVSFTDLINHRDIMDEKHYEPFAFWGVSGGFEVTLNGNFTVFHSCSFYCLVKATSFLIHSLYWIKSRISKWFDTSDEFPDDVSINPTPNTRLRIQRVATNDISFSYLPLENNYTHKRGDRYFSDIRLNIDSWFEQADFALSEYFKIIMKIMENRNKSDRLIQTMGEYLKVWQDISEQ